MINLMKIAFLLAFFVITLSNTTEAAISLRLKQIPDSTFRNIDTKQSPIFIAYIHATRNNEQFVLTKNNLIIQENNKTSFPKDIESPDADGWQKISWYSRMRGYLQLNVIRFIAFQNNEHGYINGAGPFAELPRVRIYTIKHEPIPEIDFGNVNPGDTGLVKMKVFAITGIVENGYEQKIFIDSIKTHTSAFRAVWKGSISDRVSLPPMYITSPFTYKMYIYFEPESEDYYQDKFSVYYEGGLKEEIRLKGNKYEFIEETLLKLNQPEAGKTLIPCNTYQIKWEGNIIDVPTHIEFSSDNGASWNPIAQVRDTVYNWKVPMISSEDFYIRIRQEFVNTAQKNLTVSQIPVKKVTFTTDSRKLLSINEAGELYEWVNVGLERSEPYKIPYINFPINIIKPYGLSYLKDNERFAVAYHNSTDGKKYLSYFNSGNFSPTKTVPINADYEIKYTKTDNNKQILAVVPDMGTALQILDLESGEFIRELNFNAPITSLSFNQVEPEFLITLYDGSAMIISTTDFQTIKEFDFSDLPIILKTDISPNGKYIALGCKQPISSLITGNMAEIHVVDVEKGRIIATKQYAASDPAGLAFSPGSNILLIGANYTPQLTLWDLQLNKITGQMGSGNSPLNDFQFAPNGTSLVMADNSANNLIIKYFTFPESYQSGKMRVVLPEFTIESMEIEPHYFGTVSDHKFPVSFCNNGEVPFAIENGWISTGKSFALGDDIYRDTLYPGECIDIHLIFTPLDTGYIEDVLYIRTCAEIYKIPISSFGIPRDIEFFSELFDFGKLCLSESIEKEIVLAKNNDPVPVLINSISTIPPFYLLSEIKDTLLQPGESIKVRIQFSPFRIGDMVSKIKIFHSDQEFLIPYTELTGNGVGVDVSLSSNSILFIPEIDQRELTITNKLPNSISIIDYYVEPEGIFEIIENLPLEISAKGTGKITLHYTGAEYDNVTFTLIFDPCQTERPFFIRPYKAQSTVFINVVEADPKSDVEIPIEFITAENGSYNGERIFETEITINPRIFFPESVTSDFGNAHLIKNQVLNDRRIIGIRVEGDFPSEGTIARIKGVPGLAEIDTSMINFIDDTKFWGLSVSTTTEQGVFRLINLCEDRRILQQGINIDKISPLPANDEIEIEFSTGITGIAHYEIYDDLGNLISKGTINITNGKNSISLSVSELSPGSYKLVIRQGGIFGVAKLIIIK